METDPVTGASMDGPVRVIFQFFFLLPDNSFQISKLPISFVLRYGPFLSENNNAISIQIPGNDIKVACVVLPPLG